MRNEIECHIISYIQEVYGSIRFVSVLKRSGSVRFGLIMKASVINYERLGLVNLAET